MAFLTRARLLLILAVLCGFLFVSLLASLYLGPVQLGIDFSEIGSQFWNLLRRQELSQEGVIVFRIRLPRALLAVLVGGGLGLAGASFQALLRNPLADPYILGVSGGSAFTAVLGMIFSFYLGFAVVPLFAFLGALLAIFLVLSVARIGGRMPVLTLLLAGVVVNAFFSALVMLVLSIAPSHHLPSAIFWMMGGLSPKNYWVIGLVGLYYLPGIFILLGMAREFNLFSLGEESAEQLGVNVEKSKLVAFIFASLVTAVGVSVSGLIGFLGLIVPHIIRLIFGPDHRLLLPASFIFGAIFLIWCDFLARMMIAPAELPVGVITALLGGPFFIWLLHKTKEILR